MGNKLKKKKPNKNEFTLVQSPHENTPRKRYRKAGSKIGMNDPIPASVRQANLPKSTKG